MLARLFWAGLRWLGLRLGIPPARVLSGRVRYARRTGLVAGLEMSAYRHRWATDEDLRAATARAFLRLSNRAFRRHGVRLRLREPLRWERG